MLRLADDECAGGHAPRTMGGADESPRVSGSDAMASQVGGDHYRKLAIQPIEYILKNNIGFAEGCVIKYVTRWRAKGGIDDLKKARHFLDLLIEHETR
jgi:hypothetical protein